MDLAKNLLITEDYSTKTKIFILPPVSLAPGTMIASGSLLGNEAAEEDICFDKLTKFSKFGSVAPGSFFPKGSIIRVAKSSMDDIEMCKVYVLDQNFFKSVDEIHSLLSDVVGCRAAHANKLALAADLYRTFLELSDEFDDIIEKYRIHVGSVIIQSLKAKYDDDYNVGNKSLQSLKDRELANVKKFNELSEKLQNLKVRMQRSKDALAIPLITSKIQYTGCDKRVCNEAAARIMGVEICDFGRFNRRVEEIEGYIQEEILISQNIIDGIRDQSVRVPDIVAILSAKLTQQQQQYISIASLFQQQGQYYEDVEEYSHAISQLSWSLLHPDQEIQQEQESEEEQISEMRDGDSDDKSSIPECCDESCSKSSSSLAQDLELYRDENSDLVKSLTDKTMEVQKIRDELKMAETKYNILVDSVSKSSLAPEGTNFEEIMEDNAFMVSELKKLMGQKELLETRVSELEEVADDLHCQLAQALERLDEANFNLRESKLEASDLTTRYNDLNESYNILIGATAKSTSVDAKYNLLIDVNARTFNDLQRLNEIAEHQLSTKDELLMEMKDILERSQEEKEEIAKRAAEQLTAKQCELERLISETERTLLDQTARYETELSAKDEELHLMTEDRNKTDQEFKEFLVSVSNENDTLHSRIQELEEQLAEYKYPGSADRDDSREREISNKLREEIRILKEAHEIEMMEAIEKTKSDVLDDLNSDWSVRMDEYKREQEVVQSQMKHENSMLAKQNMDLTDDLGKALSEADESSRRLIEIESFMEGIRPTLEMQAMGSPAPVINLRKIVEPLRKVISSQADDKEIIDRAVIYIESLKSENEELRGDNVILYEQLAKDSTRSDEQTVRDKLKSVIAENNKLRVQLDELQRSDGDCVDSLKQTISELQKQLEQTLVDARAMAKNIEEGKDYKRSVESLKDLKIMQTVAISTQSIIEASQSRLELYKQYKDSKLSRETYLNKDEELQKVFRDVPTTLVHLYEKMQTILGSD